MKYRRSLDYFLSIESIYSFLSQIGLLPIGFEGFDMNFKRDSYLDTTKYTSQATTMANTFRRIGNKQKPNPIKGDQKAKLSKLEGYCH